MVNIFSALHTGMSSPNASVCSVLHAQLSCTVRGIGQVYTGLLQQASIDLSPA